METANTTTSFKGSFKDWLHAKGKDPKQTESSKSRLLRLIKSAGENAAGTIRTRRIYGDDSLTAYNAFNMFYGVERSIYQVANSFLTPATMGGETDKQAVVLIGPPGAGKSDFVTRIKNLFRTAEPVPYVKFSRVHDNPLNLFYMVQLVAEKQADAELESGKDFDFAARVDAIKLEILESLELGSLLNFEDASVKAICSGAGQSNTLAGIAKLEANELVSAVVAGLGLPRSTRNAVGTPEPLVQDLVLGVYQRKGKPIAIKDMQIDSMRFTDDFSGSSGIVDVAEVQPLNFDIAEWIGSENLANMSRFEEGDPRLVNLNGAFNKGNRGLVILTEGLKNPPEAQRVLLEALQGRRVKLPTPLAGSCFFDGLIIIHSNEGEYDKFMKVRENEPYADRFFRIWFPYPLEMSQAEKVIRKFWNGSEFAKPVNQGGVHVDPDVFPYLARMEVLTRIDRTNPQVPLNVKADAYDGRSMRDRGMGMKISVQDLRERASTREGLEGQSPRETNKVMQLVAAKVQGRGDTVTTALLRDAFRDWFKQTITDEKRLEFMMGIIRNELDEVRRKGLSQLVLASLVEGFKDECQQTWDKYLDNVRAWASNTSVKSSAGYSKSQVGGDESFMREIESDPDWGVTSAEAPKFRAEIQAAVNQFITEHGAKNIPYTCHQAVQKCLERFVLKKVRSGARLFSSSSARSDEDRRKLSAAKTRLVEAGFSEWSAEELLREAEENADFLVER
jgi:predicted Ser/Thr protein kinase